MENVKIQLPKPHPSQQRILDSNARFKVLLCGRRFGKTLLCQIITIQKMLEGKAIAFITPSHDLNRDFFRVFQSFLPQSIILSDNKTDREITIINGGSVKFFSGESLEQFRGRQFDLVICDEAASIPNLKNAWNTAIRPTLLDRLGQAIFISTPKGREYFHSLYLKGKNGDPHWESFHFTSYDNPHLPESEIDAMKLELGSFEFNQEIMAIPGYSGSLVYTHWQICKEVPENAEVFYGLDWGYNNPTALVKISLHDQNIYVEEKIYQTKLTTNDLSLLMKDLGIESHDEVFYDNAEPKSGEELIRCGFNALPCDKRSMLEGIRKVSSMPLFITESSKNVIKELSNYKWKVDKEGNTLDQPIKLWDHACDALRYAVFTKLAVPQLTWGAF